jgi:hypothetical protein
MRQVALAVVLASLVALAGCGGATDGGSPTSTGSDTQASPTATATSTPSLEDVDYPDGAGADGFTDPSGLQVRQQALLNETSFTLSYDVERVAGPKSGTNASLHTVYTPEGSVTNLNSESSNAVIWSDEGGTALKSGSEGQTSYAYYDRNSSYVEDVYRNYGLSIGPQLVRQYIEAFEYEATGTYRSDGHTYVEYESTAVNESYGEGGQKTNFVGGNVSLVLRGDGLVTEFDAETTVETDEGKSERESTYRVTDVGSTTADEPGWLDQEIPTVEAEPVGDGSVLKVTHAGGPAIEGGQLLVSVSSFGQVQLEEFSDGDTVYVTAVEDGRQLNLTLHDQRPEPGADAVDFSAADEVLLQIGSQSVTVTMVVGSEDDEN